MKKVIIFILSLLLIPSVAVCELRINGDIISSSGTAESWSSDGTTTSTTQDVAVTGTVTTDDFITKGPWIDPRAYGVVGGETVDDTTALQDAFTALVTSKGRLKLAPGTYKITSKLELGDITDCYLDLSGANIVQYTDNTPILEFTKENVHNFRIDGGVLYWHTQQTAAHTASVAIAFNPDAQTGLGFYDFSINDVTIYSGYRGIAITGTEGYIPVWGCTIAAPRIVNIVAEGIYLGSPTAMGMPAIRIVKPHIDYGTSTQTAAAIKVNVAAELLIDTPDLENLDIGVGIQLTSCSSFQIINPHVEHIDLGDNGYGVFMFAQSSGEIRGGSVSDGSGAGVDIAGGSASIVKMTSVDANYGKVTVSSLWENVAIVAGSLYFVQSEAGGKVTLANCRKSAATTWWDIQQNGIKTFDGNNIELDAMVSSPANLPTTGTSLIYTRFGEMVATLPDPTVPIYGQTKRIINVEITNPASVVITGLSTTVTFTGANQVLDLVWGDGYWIILPSNLWGLTTLEYELKLDEMGIEGQPTDAIGDCSSFSATGGGIFYDDSENKWKKCQDNVLTDLDTDSTFSVTDITSQTDDSTPATTATAVLAQSGSLIESTIQQIIDAVSGANLTGMTLSQFISETAWRLFYSNASGDMTGLALGEQYQAFTSGGASAAPMWAYPNWSAEKIWTTAPTGGDLVVGKVYRADNDTWDPITYAGTDDYYVIWTGAAWKGVLDVAGNLLVDTLTLGGIVLGDSTPDADGEYGFASNAYKWYANSEDFVLTAGTNLWTISSNTGVTDLSFSAINLVTTGTIQGGIVINSDADGMSAAEMTAVGLGGTLFIATGEGTWILPDVAAAGQAVCLMDSGTAHDLILDVTTGSTIRLKGTEQADAIGITNASGTSTGDFICVVSVAAHKWSTLGMQGTWASQ